jgi:hypothetical protein
MWPFLDMWGSLSANREFRGQDPSIFRNVLSLTHIGPSASSQKAKPKEPKGRVRTRVTKRVAVTKIYGNKLYIMSRVLLV